MGLDEDDQPKGALIGMTLLTCIVLFIVIGTFDSCTNLEMDKVQKYCSDVRMVIEGPIGEKRPCLGDDGRLQFTLVNVGDVDIEGLSFRFRGQYLNQSKECYKLSSQRYDPLVGQETYEIMAPVEVIPIVYYKPMNGTTTCGDMKMIIKDISYCTGY